EGDGAATSHVAKAFPKAGAVVDGRTVREHIPNMDSIAASLDDYEVMPGVREVPMAAFTLDEAPLATDARTVALADAIKQSKELNPLIYEVDDTGSTILE